MIYRSAHPDIAIPGVPLHRLILESAAARGEMPALVDGPSGRVLTYAALAAGVDRVAAGLAARGFRKGDVLALFAPNVPEFALALLGTLAAGGVVTPVGSLATAHDIEKQLRDADARFLVTVPAFLDRALPAARASNIEEVFVVGVVPDATPFSALLTSAGPAPDVAIDPAVDVAVLPYSSGTTGLAKGVMLTHRNLVANLFQTAALWRLAEGDRVIAVLPFFHIYGLNVILNLGLWRGTTLVTMPRFDLEGFLGLLETHRITHALLVPPIVLALAKHPAVERYDLSSLRLVNCGAAPLDAALQAACAARLRCHVIQGYGMTETSPVTHICSDQAGRSKAGTVGELVPNTECRIVDVATGADLPRGVDGELLVRGPQVMRGYLNRPDATAATLDSEGWLHTGDIGHMDDDGHLSVVDRVKELIKCKGYQVAPAELEAVLLTHPAVHDAAVIGVPDAEAGEVPWAFVVLQEGVAADTLMAFVADRVAPYKKIRHVEVIDAIPKSPSGKILRRVLKERAVASPKGGNA